MHLIKKFLLDTKNLILVLIPLGMYFFGSFANTKNTLISSGWIALENQSILINPILPFRWVFFALFILAFAVGLVLCFYSGFKGLDIHFNWIVLLLWVGLGFGCLYQLAEPVSTMDLVWTGFGFYLFSWFFARYFYYYYSET